MKELKLYAKPMIGGTGDRVRCLKAMREVVRSLGLKEAVEFIRDEVPISVTEKEWRALRPVFREFGVRAEFRDERPPMDPLDWLSRVGGGIVPVPSVTGGRRMFAVVVERGGFRKPWQGPLKRHPRLAVERAMAAWARKQARERRRREQDMRRSRRAGKPRRPTLPADGSGDGH